MQKMGPIRTLMALARASSPSKIADLQVLSGLPASTLYRDLKALCDLGIAIRVSVGTYSLSPDLLSSFRKYSLDAVLAEAARPSLRRLSKRTGLTAHLGVLDEAMVLYLVKEATSDTGLFTREGQKLEAYCSAVGKVLLAALAPEELDRYLSDDAVALTRFTLTERTEIEDEIARVARSGFAEDRQEVSETLACIAAPVRSFDGPIIAAISLSGERTSQAGLKWMIEDNEGRLALRKPLLEHLSKTADEITGRLFPDRG